MNVLNPISKVSQVRITSPLLSGFVTGLLWLTAGTVLLSLVLTYTGMKEESLPSYIYTLHGIAILFGGLSAGRKSRQKGWYYGGLTGLMYGLFIFIVGFLGFDAGVTLSTLVSTAASFAAGAVGGMLGVNLRK
ncbi:TIGR04086 family membrane protein [Paenibacillus gansuensis]|uniref:TIGR04086 family membrane protein n=1 Tax=Paenibacillus gansuensis TaxID=306542 RepID=A0ABW5PCJ5_9BACL